MATIESLSTSISHMPRSALFDLLGKIRTQRRLRPAPRQKSTPAKVARAPKKGNLKQQDLFQYANGLTEDAKAKLAAELIRGLMG